MLKRLSNSVRIYYPKLDKDKLVSFLKQRAENLSKQLPIKTIVLFGSYATRRYTAASDVDVLAVVYGQYKGLYQKIHEGLGISNLQLHLYTVDEYGKLKKNSPSFVREIKAKGILIFQA